MRGVSRKARIHERGKELRGLPRGHPPPPDGAKLRTMPYSAGVEYRGSAGEGSPESLPSVGGACRGGMRGVPQTGGHRDFLWPIHTVRLLPHEGLAKHYQPPSRG